MSSSPLASAIQPAGWLTSAEFLAITGMPRRTFFRRKALLTTRRDGNRLLISAAELPEALRAQLTATPLDVEVRNDLPAAPEAALPLFAALHQAEAQPARRRIALPPEQEAAAHKRLAILQPLLDFTSALTPEAKLRFAQLRKRDGKNVRTANDLAVYLAETHSTADAPLSRTTLWNWKARYEADGLVGLARKLRADKGVYKWAEQYPDAAALVAATFLQPFATRQRAYDALRRDAAGLGMSTVPSYAAVCDYLGTLPPPAVVLAREGERAHNERMAPYLKRGYTDIGANDVWVADTMIHDVLVRNDCFGDRPGNEAVRLQLTALMDLRTRKLVGYTWVLDGSSRSITTALIRAVKAYGPCKTFYCDNGRDFQKVGRFAQPANRNAALEDEVQLIERTGALRQLGIAVQYCIKFHPQSKPIERFFRTLHLRLDAHFRHYTTGNAYLKPDATVEAAAKHGKLLRMGSPERSPLMAASHFVRMAEMWIEQDYNAQHAHRGQGMNGRTPDAVFDELYPLAERRGFDPAVLDTLLWRREKRLVRECAVTVAGRRLIGASAYAAEVLYRANETEVIVCFDPNAPELGVVTDLDGHKLAEVRAERFATQSDAAGPMIAASMQQRRELRNNTAESIRQLRKQVVIRGHVTEVELLHERALLPAPSPESMTQPVAEAAASYGAKLFHSDDIGDALAATLAAERSGTYGA